MRLSPYDTTDPPYPVGTVLRLRSVEAWAGVDYGRRPIVCEYSEDGMPKAAYWTAELDKHVGGEFVVIAGPVGLPFVRLADRPDDGGGWQLHPDWLEELTPPDPAGEPCRCDMFSVVMVIGCRCGRMQRERGLKHGG